MPHGKGPGRVAISMKEADGRPASGVCGVGYRISIWQYPPTLPPYADKLFFLGGMLKRTARSRRSEIVADLMRTIHGPALPDFYIANLDLHGPVQVWSKDDIPDGTCPWPETRFGRSQPWTCAAYSRNVGYPRAPYVGLLADSSQNPVVTTTIDGTPGLSNILTCASDMPLRGSAVDITLQRAGMGVDVPEGSPLQRIFGVRFVAKDKALWLRPPDLEHAAHSWWADPKNWRVEPLLPAGEYSLWLATWQPVDRSGKRSGPARTAIFPYGGDVPEVHDHFGLVLNTEHLTGTPGEGPICVSASHARILRDAPDIPPDTQKVAASRWEKLPAWHYHTKEADPGEAVYSANGAVFVTTTPLQMPEITPGTVWVP